jgi:hypothetical protein
MISAKALSEAIRMKRKKLKEDGVEEMIDTAPGPQMNPQDILNLKQKAQMEETLDTPEKSMAPDDPADPELDETQEESGLKKRMARVKSTMSKMKMSK